MHVQVLKVMGCSDPAHSGDLQVTSRSLTACMIASGMRPREDAFLGSLVEAYRRFALKDLVVCCPKHASFAAGVVHCSRATFKMTLLPSVNVATFLL